MNKYVEKVEKYKEKVLVQALEKLKTEYEEAEDFYRDSGYDRYFKKMNKCEKEIREIEEYLNPTPMVNDITTDQYRDFLNLTKTMKSVKSNLIYIMDYLPDCTEKARLQECIREIEDYQFD